MNRGDEWRAYASAAVAGVAITATTDPELVASWAAAVADALVRERVRRERDDLCDAEESLRRKAGR